MKSLGALLAVLAWLAAGVGIRVDAQAATAEQGLCIALLDVSQTVMTDPHSTVLTDVQRTHLNTLGSLAKACVARGERVEIWLIHGTSDRDPGPFASIDPKQKDWARRKANRSRETWAALVADELLCPVRSLMMRKMPKCMVKPGVDISRIDMANTDILGAIARVSERLADPGHPRSRLVVLSDGMQNTEELSFLNLLMGDESTRTDLLRSKKMKRFLQLPEISGCFLGIGASSGDALMDGAFRAGLRAFWRDYFEKAGASGIKVADGLEQCR